MSEDWEAMHTNFINVDDRTKAMLSKIKEGEPTFLLRAQDFSAPWALEEWIKHAKANGAKPDVISNALRILHEMNEWQDAHLPKVADL